MSAEFASAAMLRVLIQGLRELNLPPLEKHIYGTHSNSATVDLDLKLAVVQHALKHGGVGCLIHLGRGVHQHANEPTHRAMVSAKEPADLVVRWQRLERYIHSRHRLRIAAQGEGWMELTHDGIKEGIFPTLYESLVVFGVLATGHDFQVRRVVVPLVAVLVMDDDVVASVLASSDQAVLVDPLAVPLQRNVAIRHFGCSVLCGNRRQQEAG
jgi:hypothetical protein